MGSKGKFFQCFLVSGNSIESLEADTLTADNLADLLCGYLKKKEKKRKLQIGQSNY